MLLLRFYEGIPTELKLTFGVQGLSAMCFWLDTLHFMTKIRKNSSKKSKMVLLIYNHNSILLLLLNFISVGAYYFHEDYWHHISPEAMDLIRKMLCVSQKDRWTAEQLLNHPWLKASDEQLEAKDITKSLDEMKRFLARRKFKAAGKAIAGRLTSSFALLI